MKKVSVVLLAALFSAGLLLAPSVTHAVEGKVGVTMMYDWWKPGYINMVNESAAKLLGSNVETNYDGSFMLGPTFSIGIADGWKFGTTLLFGLSRNQFEYSTLAADIKLFSLPGWDAYLDIGESKIRRYDWDISFDWGFHKYFDLLIGVRFNYGDGEGVAYRFGLVGQNFDYKTEEFGAWYLGPMVGVAFHYEFVEGFTMNLGVAALIQFGQYNNEKKLLLSGNPMLIYYLMPLKYEAGYFCVGLNSDLRFAYLIAPAHLEIFVGGRYVVLPHIKAGDDGSVMDITYKKGWIGGRVEHWGGIYFGAAYKF